MQTRCSSICEEVDKMPRDSGGKVTGGWAPWVSVSKTVAMDESLTAADRSVYLALCSYMNSETRTGYPSRKTLRNRARVSETTLSKSIQTLEDAGYIQVIRKFKTDANGIQTKERAPNDYHIVNI